MACNVFRMDITPRTIAEALHRTIQRDPNPHATVADALLAEEPTPELLIDVADPDQPGVTRSFIVHVRDVDESTADQVERLAGLIAEARGLTGHGRISMHIAHYLVQRGVRL